MKRLLIFGLLTFFLAVSLQAQHRWAIKGGLNYSNVRDQLSPDHAPELAMTQGLAGFHIGLIHQKQFSDRLALELELLYNTKGTKVSFLQNHTNQRFHYLSLPAVLSWNVSGKLSLRGGLELSFLLDSKMDGPIRILDKDRKFDAGAILGMAVHLKNSRMLEARYIHGLTPLSNLAVFDQTAAAEAEYSWYNQVLQLSLSQYF